MFTGIIQAKGSIHEVHSSEKGAVLIINSNGLDFSDLSWSWCDLDQRDSKL